MEVPHTIKNLYITRMEGTRPLTGPVDLTLAAQELYKIRADQVRPGDHIVMTTNGPAWFDEPFNVVSIDTGRSPLQDPNDEILTLVGPGGASIDCFHNEHVTILLAVPPVTLPDQEPPACMTV